jgi:chromosomal replication initiation ATPase DnaA
LGTKGFKGKILFQKLDQDRDQEKQQKTLYQINKNKLLKIDQIVDLVADIFDVKTSKIINYNRGRKSLNIPRSFAMFLCQKYKDLTLTKISHYFNLKHKGSFSKAMFRIKEIIKSG